MPRSTRAASVDDDSPFEVDRYAAGDRISDKYRLETPLGFGSMGMLWRAHNDVLDAPVALKLLRKDARWSWSSERLLREARTMASLRHPAIVRVFDYGMTTRRDPFIVMELLRGETLRDMMDREAALSAVEAMRVLLPILEGLDCAHARGVVHRDLKPENIFLSRDDSGRLQPKLLDFGIAKLEGMVSRLTTGGVLLGSPSYMSPEQAEGEEQLDSRIDVWAAAVVLYEMIAGRPPWDAANCPALLRAIAHDDAPTIVGTGGVDPHLWSILELALAKKRENRWSSCRDFGWALASWLASRSIADDVSGTSLTNGWLAPGPRLALPSHHEPTPAEASVQPSVRAPRLRKVGILSAAAAMAAAFSFLAIRDRRTGATIAAPSHSSSLVQPMAAVEPPTLSPSVPEETEPAVNPPPRVAPKPSAISRRGRAPSPRPAKPVGSASLDSAPPPHAPIGAPARPKSAQGMDFGF